ncbi:glycosyltransferase N-terminal domain-containing protein [Paracoccus sp. S1E-3]|uniref:3-deoxy-D-manno-octulosonic acid transferase n=1 Tax=Paracoccus sp. S1E-3 TaxID=2756130 RepID=UPI0015EFB033|nr:glycosyltransferase N-terminal domain-containing protein [Paracoccus sp. S1E-3]MBA4490889.1 3-deoxy-D-manno-octulosonic acid transferase [Paracoccus sp. S1E-3]
MRRWLDQPDQPLPLPDLALPTGEGPLVWLRIGAGYDQVGPEDGNVPPALIQLLMQMRRRGLQIAVSRAVGGMPDLSKRGVSSVPDAVLSDAQAAAQLAAMQPDAVLLVGPDLPGPLIDAASARDIPVILAETRLSPPRRGWVVPGLGRRSWLSQLTLLLLPDPASRDAALEMGAPPERIEVTGPITLTREPLKHLEAERAALAEAFKGRQVWLAVNVTEAEEDALIEAQLTVLRYSHRAMLIVLPDDPRRAEAMAARMSDAGLVVAQRNLDEDPTEEVSVYLADDLFELGLWYRLAPSTFMGSTLYGPTDTARDPFEAASLGSAAIHGPLDGPYTAEWAQLDGAAAARRVEDAAGLSQAVVALLAADQAAQIAANAWSVSTGGEGVANRIAHAVRDTILGDSA